MTPNPSPKTLAVEHGKIAYDAVGEGSPVVLLHQGIVDRRVWDRELGTLAKGNQVVRYDLRGFGASGGSDGPFSHVRDLRALTQHLDLRRPLLVGPSIGGRIALDFALTFPDAVGGLLLLAPAFSGMDYPMFPDGKAALEEDDRRSGEIARAWKEGRSGDAIEGLRQLWAAALEGEPLERFRTMVRENAQEVFGEATGQKEERTRPTAAERLPTLKVPTWVAVGDRDNPACPHFAKYIVKQVPGARYVPIPGADHLVNLSRPAAFDALVHEALGRLAKG